MLIREIKPDDAGSFINLIMKVESESEFMLLEPGERKIVEDEQKKRLEVMRKSYNSTIFIAQDDKQLIGYLIGMAVMPKETNILYILLLEF